MKQIINVKFTMIIISIICIALIVSPICNAGFNLKTIKRNNTVELQNVNHSQENSGTEYWALLFAVGIYYKNPDMDRPSMLEAADALYDVLIDSPQWEPDHIRMTTGEQATGKNLIRDLIWLIQSEDADDMSLIYLTTHGSPLKNQNGYPVDLPPKDEADGADEMLVMYHGFDRWYSFVWDDLLNFFLNRLQSRGVCVIVDSCYSGGFNDPPRGAKLHDYNVESFTQGLGEELASQGRIVLMSCREDELSYGSFFSELLIEGFWGWADVFGNGDGINSAEEAFDYADFILQLFGDQDPTILDLYPGEYPVTY